MAGGRTDVPASPRLSFTALWPLLVALLYGASPIDLIPDLIPLLGWSDDVAVLLVAVLVVLRSVNALRHRRQDRIQSGMIVRPQPARNIEAHKLEPDTIARFELP